ncbi:MAG: alpha/beta hydrolase [Cyanobacteria bacterium P01_G01_bin.54]
MITQSSPLRISRIRLPHGQLFWREVGEGPTLVFLHGSFQDGTQWLPLVEQLASRFHCLIPDLLGFGESPPPDQKQSIALQAKCLAAYLEALHLERYTLVAHSLGAWVASHFALTQPAQLQAMALISPEGVLTEAFPNRWQREKQLTAFVPVVPALLKLSAPFSRLVGKHAAIARQRAYRHQLLASSASCRLLFKRRWADLHPELLNERLEHLQVRTQVLQGGQDDPAVIAQSKTFVRLCPAAQLRMLKEGDQALLSHWSDSIAYEIERLVLNTQMVVS